MIALTDERPTGPRAAPAERPGRGPRSPGYEVVDHTSEVTLRVCADSFEGLIQEATKGFGALVPEGLRGAPSMDVRDFSIAGLDHEATLVAWLNELVYLSEIELWLPEEVQADSRADGLRVRARGVTLREPFVGVKAATLHGAEIRESDGRLEVEVTLDL